jgi:hypothetical protein
MLTHYVLLSLHFCYYYCYAYTGSFAVPESWELPEGWDVEKNAWMPGTIQAAAIMPMML